MLDKITIFISKIIKFFTAEKGETIGPSSHNNIGELKLNFKIKPINLDLGNLENVLNLNLIIENESIKKSVIELLKKTQQRELPKLTLMLDPISDQIYLSAQFKKQQFRTELHKLASAAPMTGSDVERMEVLLKTEKRCINALDNDGNTPLHVAVLWENLTAIKLLVTYDADLFLKNRKDQTSYQLALKSELVQDLFNNDSSVNKKVGKRYDHNINSCQKTPNIDRPVGTLKEITVEGTPKLLQERNS